MRRLPIGAELIEGGAHVRVWAPRWSQVTLVIEAPARREIALAREDGGYFAAHVPGLAAGARYRFRLGDALHPDPASRFQPDGPLGPSELVDPRFAWSDAAWPGIIAPHRQVLYELHVGTLTRAGTFAAAAERLPALAELGVTTLEVMPVNDYVGRHGWGYDGVLWFAPCRNYGTPADLRRLVDRAHALGLAVILDVVYNHLGPAGNALFAFGPYKAEQLTSEWGDTLDYAQPAVRELAIANARYWIDEFHFDGLRLDAIQAIRDDTSPHVVTEIARAARAAAGAREVFVVGEDEPQDTRLLAPAEAGGAALDALWNDDFEHSARVALLGVREAYLEDYAGTPQELISAVERAFLYQGQTYAWQHQPRGTSTRGIARARFVHYLENHDQVANHGFGERLAVLADPGALRALTAVLLLGPELPMLFQGQDTGSTAPWRFFADHDAELAAAVRRGRAEFVAQFPGLATAAVQQALPDPGARATFDACVVTAEPEPRAVALHRDLLQLRRADPTFTDPAVELDGAVLAAHAFCLRWSGRHGDRVLLVNLGATFRQRSLPEPLLAPPAGAAWHLAWSSEHPRYGGHGTPEPFTRERLAIPARAAVLLSAEAP
ncbi:MAG TPA: malto-oligosyltrehalose trehalohydrolase [Kofleriaceae bacterium]|nr:malto-oligosyltrehalose trehalohydrolase [Kofleriaceae bacterium]